jgi:hypothetical protein
LIREKIEAMTMNPADDTRRRSDEAARPDATDALAPRVDLSRRRIFRGVAGGTGVLLSVQAKTALGGGVCQSPSAMFSGNTSPRAGDGSSCSGGRSPGYWVQPQHFGAWTAAGATPPSFNPAIVECASGLGGLSLLKIATSGTTFLSVFGNDLTPKSGVTVLTPVPLWAVIYSPNSFGSIGQLARHMACAWLNAKYFAGSAAQYPMTAAQVVDMWTQVTTSGLYCPASSTCSSGGWTADQAKAYIEGLYDINAPVPNYCNQSV